MSTLVARSGSAQVVPLHPNVLLNTTERVLEGAFGAVTRGLMKLGTCPIEDLVGPSKADLEGFDLPDLSSDTELLQSSVKLSPNAASLVLDDKDAQKVPSSMQFVAQLHQTCVGAFGNSDALKYEFLEETGHEDKKRCILTIMRPNGQVRSYTTAAEFSRKSDAKARAAAIAVEMSAVDFILHGNKDASNAKLLLAPLDSSANGKVEVKKEGSPTSEVVEDGGSKQIENLCSDWRAGKVHPRWVYFKEHKGAPAWGCALLVELSPHCQRLYSVGPRYTSMPLAKKACSEAALEDDVVEFIKHGNGQTSPPPAPLDPFNNIIQQESDFDRKARLSAISLQSFFDSLPKPFPEQLEDKPVANLNIPGMLNTILQLAKGSRLYIQFYFLYENALHGSILRLERPGETRTYMVEPRFAKRTDAKAAVCLQAMFQGVGKYIRTLATAIDNKITEEMRRLANEQILPILGSEYGRLRHGMHPVYDYGLDNGAFSCTMTLSLSANPTPAETRSWSVKPEYRTKTDAKIAVVCAAGTEAIEFVRFKGQPAPPGHDPFKPFKRNNSTDQKSGAGKQSAASGQVRLGRPLFETKEQALARKKSTANWERSVSRAHRYQSVHARNAPRSVTLNYGAENPRKGLFASVSSSGVAASASAQVTSGSRTHHGHGQHGHNSGSKQQQFSKEAIAKLRPPRKSQQLQQRAQQASSSRQSPTTNPQPIQQETQQGTQQPVPQQPVPPQAVPPQPTQPPQQFMPYGTVPQLQQHAPFQPPVYPGSAYPGAYAQHQYTYAISQGAPYPPPGNAYTYPMAQAPPAAPPAYSAPGYPSYTAYYADPRYAQYPQYGMPAAPMPYAVPVPPAPGMQYSTPPMPPTVPAPTTPVISTQMNTSLPTPPTSSSAERPASAQWIEIERSSIRTASYRTEDRDREKRPRSRDTSPEDVQVHKKHRPETSKETSKGQVNVKREPVSSPPVPAAPPTPVSVPPKDSTSHVQQLVRYCESENLSSPEFGSKQVKNERGEDEFKVWIVMGKERLELPVAFASENEGRQRVAKQVLQRLRSQAAKK